MGVRIAVAIALYVTIRNKMSFALVFPGMRENADLRTDKGHRGTIDWKRRRKILAIVLIMGKGTYNRCKLGGHL